MPGVYYGDIGEVVIYFPECASRLRAAIAVPGKLEAFQSHNEAWRGWPAVPPSRAASDSRLVSRSAT
jgi:hypothetical protein